MRRGQCQFPQFVVLSRLSGLRLGRAAGLGVGTVARGGLSRNATVRGHEQAHRAGPFAARQTDDGGDGLRRTHFARRARRIERRRHRRVSFLRPRSRRQGRHRRHDAEISVLLRAPAQGIHRPDGKTAVRCALVHRADRAASVDFDRRHGRPELRSQCGQAIRPRGQTGVCVFGREHGPCGRELRTAPARADGGRLDGGAGFCRPATARH